MAVFMARGYKGPFHKHVSQGLANYFSEQTKDEIRSIISDTADPVANSLQSLLESETVTAWGAQSGLTQDQELFTQMEEGDWFLMRTARPNRIEYIQQVDLLLGQDIPRELREDISEAIWGAPNYDLLWFSSTPVVTTETSQEEFEELVSEVEPEFEFNDWFPSQRRNFARVNDEVLDALGGQQAFLERLAEQGGERLTPGVDNYFILNTRENELGVRSEHQFDFEQKSTELSDDLLKAENNGKVLLCDADGFYATARIGNIEGTRRDGSLHKVVTLLDWVSVPRVDHESILDQLSVSVQHSALGKTPGQPSPYPVARITPKDFETVQAVAEQVSVVTDGADGTAPETDQPQVFMMPVNRSRWLDQFKRTVDEPLDFGPEADRPEDLRNREPTRIWGTQTGERNEKMWGNMTPGDIMLFYSEGWFFAVGRIAETIRSPAAGDYIWENEDSELIYTVEDYQHIAIRKATVWEWFDYDENFTRRGLSRVYPDRVDAFRTQVGDIWDHITDYRIDEPIEAILADSVEEAGGTNSHTSAYFILKTGGGEYEDKPENEYHFKEGIPGSKQLRDAAGSAKFVYLEDKQFYATGKIGDIQNEDRDGTTHYFATIEEYEEIEPIALDAVRDALEQSFPMQYGIIKITQADYERIVFDDGPRFDPAEEYETVTEAEADITERLARVNDDRIAWFVNQLAASIVQDWTDALRNFGPETVVDPVQEVKFDQLRSLFNDCEDELESLAAEINSASLGQLSEAGTLFMVLLRELQDDYCSRTNTDQAKLHRIFVEAYESEKETQESTSQPTPDHPLLTHLDSHPDSAVYRFTAPPEYWLTSVATGSISFEREDESNWRQLSENDIVLFYCQQTDLDVEQEFANGFIGAGIVGRHVEKGPDEAWWWDEFYRGQSYPFVVSFDALYLTGDGATLRGPNPVDETTDPTELVAGFEALTTDLLEYRKAEDICESETGQGLAVSGTFSPFLTNGEPEHERPRLLIEAMANSGTLDSVPPIDLTRDFDGGLDQDAILDGLYFVGDRGPELIDQIESSLRAGKHLIFTGPPGTGKTEVARRVAAQLVDSYSSLYTDSQLTTATADWSTFDTVGGYMPDGEDTESDGLDFSPGVVLNRFKGRNPDVQRNEPLVIDELNRADIDKAFGQLFTLLSGQSVQLPYLKDGHEIELLNAGNLSGLPESHQYVVPESWRIFATMNTYDKTSLYEMSYAFMRRFAFIRVEVPELPENPAELDSLMKRYVSVWGDLDPDEGERLAVGHVWRATNAAVDQRSIGPAIVEDILRYITQREDGLEHRLTQAVISFVFPQLEGVPKRREILQSIAQVDEIDADEIEVAGQGMLQIDSLDNA